MCKYIFVCGGVVSGIGKGISACSMGLLLKCRGFKVQYLKLDGYLNYSASVLAPREHGETWVADDGQECDCDMGHVERLIGFTVTKDNICTSGRLYKEIISDEEDGKYMGKTLQVVPHFSDKIQEKILNLGVDHDVVIVEIGGVVGDAESYGFFEAMRQFKQRYRDDVLVAMVSPVLWLNTIREHKTKPLQNSLTQLQQYGLQADLLFCRSENEISEDILDKISKTTGLPRTQIFNAPDAETIYHVPLEFYARHIDDILVDLFRLPRSSCRIHKYRESVEKLSSNLPVVKIGVVSKYGESEAYLSLKESLVHAGLSNNVKISIEWIKAEDLEKGRVSKHFDGIDGVIVPGGFDVRGVEGKIRSIQYVREKKIPFLGICLGLQCAVIEFSRNVLGLTEANSIEFDPNTPDPVVHFVEGQENIKKKSGTMRLGAYPCELLKDSLAAKTYGKKSISERHRHRFEVNNAYQGRLEEKGFMVSGVYTPEATGDHLIEVMELDQSIHPYFIGSQGHPEFKSRLGNPAPLFDGLIAAICRQKDLPGKIKLTD